MIDRVHVAALCLVVLTACGDSGTVGPMDAQDDETSVETFTVAGRLDGAGGVDVAVALGLDADALATSSVEDGAFEVQVPTSYATDTLVVRLVDEDGLTAGAALVVPGLAADRVSPPVDAETTAEVVAWQTLRDSDDPAADAPIALMWRTSGELALSGEPLSGALSAAHAAASPFDPAPPPVGAWEALVAALDEGAPDPWPTFFDALPAAPVDLAAGRAAMAALRADQGGVAARRHEAWVNAHRHRHLAPDATDAHLSALTEAEDVAPIEAALAALWSTLASWQPGASPLAELVAADLPPAVADGWSRLVDLSAVREAEGTAAWLDAVLEAPEGWTDLLLALGPEGAAWLPLPSQVTADQVLLVWADTDATSLTVTAVADDGTEATLALGDVDPVTRVAAASLDAEPPPRLVLATDDGREVLVAGVASVGEGAVLAARPLTAASTVEAALWRAASTAAAGTGFPTAIDRALTVGLLGPTPDASQASELVPGHQAALRVYADTLDMQPWEVAALTEGAAATRDVALAAGGSTGVVDRALELEVDALVDAEHPEGLEFHVLAVARAATAWLALVPGAAEGRSHALAFAARRGVLPIAEALAAAGAPGLAASVEALPALLDDGEPWSVFYGQARALVDGHLLGAYPADAAVEALIALAHEDVAAERAALLAAVAAADPDPAAHSAAVRAAFDGYEAAMQDATWPLLDAGVAQSDAAVLLELALHLGPLAP